MVCGMHLNYHDCAWFCKKLKLEAHMLSAYCNYDKRN